MTETEAEDWARRIWGAVEYGGIGAREVQALLARVGSGAVPPQHIDRDALRDVLGALCSDVAVNRIVNGEAYLDRILALVRPVESERSVRNRVVHEVAEEMRRRSGNEYDVAAANLERDYGDGGVLL